MKTKNELIELMEVYGVPSIVDFHTMIYLTKHIIETRENYQLDALDTLNLLKRIFSYKAQGEFPTLVLIEIDNFITTHGNNNKHLFQHDILHSTGTINLKYALPLIPLSHQRSLEREVNYSQWVDTSKPEVVLFDFIKHRIRVLQWYDLPNQTLYHSEIIIPLDIMDGIITSITDTEMYGPTRIPDAEVRTTWVEQVRGNLPTHCESSILQELLDYIRWLLSIYQTGVFYFRGSEEKWHERN